MDRFWNGQRCSRTEGLSSTQSCRWCNRSEFTLRPAVRELMRDAAKVGYTSAPVSLIENATLSNHSIDKRLFLQFAIC
jgi:hypothetical protein